MATSVKISQLGNIGNNISGNSLIPIVDVTGVATTDKVNVANLGNFILGQAGNTLNAAFLSNLAYSVANAAQPNITSVGNLTSLTVVGTTDLGAVGNVTIIGGLVGQVLSTDGAGNLSWVTQSGNGGGNTFTSITMLNTPSGAANNIQYGLGNIAVWNDAGWVIGEYDIDTDSWGTEGIRINPGIEGYTDLTLPSDANASSQSVSLVNNVGNVVIGANGGNHWTFNDQGYMTIPNDGSFGALNSSILAFSSQNNNPIYIEVVDTANSDAYQWVFDNTGNLTLPGNTFAVNYANGDQVPIGGGGGSSISNANSSVTIPAASGNIEIIPGSNTISIATYDYGTAPSGYLAGTWTDQPTSGGSGTGMTVDYVCATTNDPLTSITINNPGSGYSNGDTVTIDGGNASFTLTVTSPQQWSFDTTGQINIPAESNSFNKGRIQSANGYPTLLAYGSSGEHGGPELDWMDSDDPANAFMNANVLRNTMYINDGGLYVGMNENGNANAVQASWRFSPNGGTFFPTLTVDLHNGGNQTAQTLQFGDPDQQAVITGPTPDVDINAQRIIIQGQAGNGTGEGGDVYLWAGDADTNGGDIKIYAGDADNVSAGYGGYVNIEGGSGFDSGGYVSMQGGQSSNGQGAYAQLVGGYGLSGGFANIVGGQGYGGPGGDVNITGGLSGNGLAEYGNVNIGAGASTWTFDNTGNLTIASGGAINSGNLSISSSNGIGTISSIIEDNGLLNIFGSGNGGCVAIGWQSDYSNGGGDTSQIYFNPAGNNANIIVTTGNTSGILYNWNFDNTGNLTLPSGGSIFSESFTPSGAPGNTITLQPAGSGVTTNQKLLVYPTAGDGDHIHMTSGNLYETELFLGSDNLYVKLANTGNVVVNSNDGNGNSAMWTFGTDGNLTSPGNLILNGYTEVFGSNVALIQSNDDVPLLEISTGANGSVSSIWLENITDIGNSNIAGIYTPLPGSNAVRIINGNNATTVYTWDFDNSGNFTIPGNIVTGVGSGGNITGANLISANTFTATGNITGANLIATANVLGNGYAQFTGTFDESIGANTGMVLGYAGGTPRILFGTGNTAQTFEIDNDGGNLRFYQPGSTKATLTSAGVFITNVVVTTPTALGNLTAVAGARAFVNNANLTATGNFGAQVGSGGSNTVPVWSDGTNWYIG